MENSYFIGDITDPNSGLSYKEINLRKGWSIPLGSLVEISDIDSEYNGLRLFVVEHTRDFDGTPLYRLSFDKNWQIDMFGEYYKILSQYTSINGFNEECLIVI